MTRAATARSSRLHVEPQAGGHLVVAAPPGVQLGADLAGELGDPSLDRGVDVLVGRLELERPVGELAVDAVERASRSPRLRRRRATPARTRPRTWAREPAMSSARKPLVEGRRRGERQQLVGRARLEAAVPERHDARAHGSLDLLRPTSDAEPQSRTKPAESSWRNVSAAS